MIDQQTIQRIFDLADIVDVVGDFVALKKAGQNYKGFSPFTNEKTPSFFVSPSKGIFKCFSSGKGGNSVTFLMEHEKMSYPEALKFLAKKYNIEIVEQEVTEEQKQQQNERESLLIATQYANQYFQDTLFKTDEGKSVGLSYFKERGFRENIIKTFQLGYCPAGKKEFTQQAVRDGYKLEYLVKSGLTIDKNGYQFDRFSGRVMFPIHSISGQILGFGGRILTQDEKAAKYLNSPESEIYHKSKILYGIYFSKNAIIKKDKCYLVEGYTDVISLYQSGIENVVASSGTALTADQIRLVKRFTSNITILYDGDEAGIKASLRGIDLVLQEGMNVKVLLLPDGEDPDSFVKTKSSSEFEAYIQENEKDFIRFKAQLLLKSSKNDPVERAKVINEIVNSIAAIPDRITRSVYVRECSRLVDMDEQLLIAEVNKIRWKIREDELKKQRYKQVDQQKTETLNNFPAQTVRFNNVAERDIIRLLLTFGNHVLYYKEEETKKPKPVTVTEHIIQEFTADEVSFDDPAYQQIFIQIQELQENNQSWEATYFTLNADPQICNVSANILTSEHNLSKIWTKNDAYIETEESKLSQIVPVIINAFKANKVMKMLHEAQNELKGAASTNDLETILQLQQRISFLNEIKKNFSRSLNRITF